MPAFPCPWSEEGTLLLPEPTSSPVLSCPECGTSVELMEDAPALELAA